MHEEPPTLGTGIGSLAEIKHATGLHFSQHAEIQTKYRQATRGCTDAPAQVDESVIPYIRYLDNRREGESWADFTQRIDRYCAAAVGGSDLFVPVFTDDNREDNTGFPMLADRQSMALSALREAALKWDPGTSDEVVHDVGIKLAESVSVWARPPVEHEEHTADFHWNKIRCALSGAGYPIWSTIADICKESYPLCPFERDETRDEWDAALRKAHTKCGWPVQLLHLTWKQVVALFDYPDDPGRHVKFLAAAHLYKHMRVNSSDAANAVITYDGCAARIAMPTNTGNMLGAMFAQYGNMIGALGVPPKGKKPEDTPAITNAMAFILKRTSYHALLSRTPLTRLPGYLLAGTWTRLSPTGLNRDGFVQHGLMLRDAKLADAGRVLSYPGDDDSIISFEWNVDTCHMSEHAELARELDEGLPDTYDQTYPSDIFFEAIPNIHTTWVSDVNAYRSMLDAPIVASMLRSELPGLRREYPMIGFFPTSPDMDESSNQGKTTAAEAYGRAMAFGLRAQAAVDSSSAPDIRALASVIMQHGTIILDEWRLPKSKAHVLSRESLQSLCTGGDVPAGRVLKNEGTLRLAHSLVFSAKAIDFPVDMSNRLIPVYLNDLTDEQRENGTLFEQLQRGQVSMAMRLGALGVITDDRFADCLASVPLAGSSKGLRFNNHRRLASALYMHRTGCSVATAVAKIDEVYEDYQRRHETHTIEAETVGTFDALETNSSLRVPLDAMFEGLTFRDLESMRQHILDNSSHRTRVGGGVAICSATELLKSRAHVASLEGRPLSDLLPFMISGGRRSVSDKQVVKSMCANIRRLMPEESAHPIPDHPGWFLNRHKDHARAMFLSLEYESISESDAKRAAETLADLDR